MNQRGKKKNELKEMRTISETSKTVLNTQKFESQQSQKKKTKRKTMRKYLGDYFLPHFREVFNYYLLKYFFMVFLFVFFFWKSYDLHVGVFNTVLEVSEIVLISFFRFSFFPSDSLISTILSSNPLILFSTSVILLFGASRVFFYLIYCIIHYILTLFLFFLGPC